MAKQDKAIRKRQQISSANRNMFISIAIASALVGFAIVAAVFLYNKISFNVLVLSEKNKTVATLKQNNINVKNLESEIKVLQTNEPLRTVRISPDQDALKVILDALPATANSSALGASLKDRLFSIPNITIESLVVNSTSNEEATAESTLPTGEIQPTQIDFQFKIIGEVNNLNLVLKNLERSIRAISVDNLQFQVAGGGSTSSLTVSGHAYYLPMQEAKLGIKKVESQK